MRGLNVAVVLDMDAAAADALYGLEARPSFERACSTGCVPISLRGRLIATAIFATEWQKSRLVSMVFGMNVATARLGQPPR